MDLILNVKILKSIHPTEQMDYIVINNANE
jgi:hypothetical protein